MESSFYSCDTSTKTRVKLSTSGIYSYSSVIKEANTRADEAEKGIEAFRANRKLGHSLLAPESKYIGTPLRPKHQKWGVS
mmetsp:Transcript_59433/g.116582  ORF Transcript_59433/g.116582 Transcript_59433/m.116582 type:complete len:80 (-) Transcript_59433:217-456(-)